MHAINGFVYRNLPGLSMCKGDKTTWHLSGLGSETDVISLYFQGNRFLYRQNRKDTISVFPHISHTVTMEPDSMGQFEVVSATVDHYRGGMRANYTVEKCGLFQRQAEMMRHSKTFYIAAMEIDWEYSPNRTWEVEMFRGHEDNPAPVFLEKSDGFIGSTYKKVVYRQFTNDKFTKEVERTPDMDHLGIMGPMIHASVGDKVKVVFKNMASRPYSIHAHGVKTESPDVYKTKPGETHTYTWYINKNTGPTTDQEECSVSAYYSTADVTKDLYSGLIGPLVICRRSWARSLGLKKEVEEFALLFLVFDENESWYLDENIRRHIRNPRPNLKDDEAFIESNKMHGEINTHRKSETHLIPEGLNITEGKKCAIILQRTSESESESALLPSSYIQTRNLTPVHFALWFLFFALKSIHIYNIQIYTYINKKVHLQHLYAVVLYSIECSTQKQPGGRNCLCGGWF
ncbi:hypothetical protein GOODEAATRI_031534 [Goodea atripinnis]|uniref:Plastocyanin-like domain-containing protein n=1 Tax=Goodea atripinnis TaxID=208336 RepID=A0ABV0PIL2_9TELE